GHLYIVMELLEGETLRGVLSARRLSIEECVSIGRDVARALARAHTGDVIHRDVKPENIFITHPSPDILLAKVLDFGLARPGAPVGGGPSFAARGDGGGPAEGGTHDETLVRGGRGSAEGGTREPLPRLETDHESTTTELTRPGEARGTAGY